MDEDRRRLERLASMGDVEAQARLNRVVERNKYPACLLTPAPGQKKVPHQFRQATDEETLEFQERWPDHSKFKVCKVCNGVERVWKTLFPSFPNLFKDTEATDPQTTILPCCGHKRGWCVCAPS